MKLFEALKLIPKAQAKDYILVNHRHMISINPEAMADDRWEAVKLQDDPELMAIVKKIKGKIDRRSSGKRV